MARLNITKEQTMLLQLVGHNLFSAPCNVDDDVDWAEVVNESKAQAVPLLAFKEYRTLPIGESVATYLRKYFEKYVINNFVCIQGHKYVHKLMSENGVPYCILKGAASALRYPEPMLRGMGDVDFYVDPPCLERAKEVLLADGFEQLEGEHSYHICYKKGKMYIELHFAPIGHPSADVAPVFFEYWSDLCEKAELEKGNFGEYALPSDFHHGFILLSHLQSHLFLHGVGLRHLCDWAVFADAFSDEAFVSLFEVKLKRAGLWRLAQALSLVAVKYLGMTYKPWMGDDYETADALLEEILHSGNFGRREKRRYYEDLFISNNGKISTKKPRIFRMFSSMNRIVRSHWKVVEKRPLLYPIGWVYFTICFLFKLITGRRKVNLFNVYRQSGKRIKLYKNLSPLKPEE